MLITEFEAQKENLTELDLWISWQCLESMERDQERWLAFYNCGEFSGARSTPLLTFYPPFNRNANLFSQQHKHIQFIPLPSKMEFSPFPDYIVESGNKERDPSIPFQHFISSLPSIKNASTLDSIYRRLLSQANPENVSDFSYNFVMTTDWIFVCPRTKDDFMSEEGHKIAVNSTGMVGLLLTKSPEETTFLEKIGPMTVLQSVGKAW